MLLAHPFAMLLKTAAHSSPRGQAVLHGSVSTTCSLLPVLLPLLRRQMMASPQIVFTVGERDSLAWVVDDLTAAGPRCGCHICGMHRSIHMHHGMLIYVYQA